MEWVNNILMLQTYNYFVSEVKKSRNVQYKKEILENYTNTIFITVCTLTCNKICIYICTNFSNVKKKRFL